MNKIKLMIKVLIYINALLFITFYFLPSSKVFANFTDSVSLNAGIQLTLGNLSLSPEKDETITGLTYLGGDPVLLSTHHLKNEGTLKGKLAYKIQVNKKGTNIPVNDDKVQLIMNFGSEIGDKVIPVSKINAGSYSFVTDNENKEWIVDGNLKNDVPITIKYKNDTIQDSDQDIDIIVTFLLVQTNVSEPKETMFYDKVSFKHELKLKAPEIPDSSNPNYWPAADDKNWKWNGEVKYNDAQFENIMYFSEIENSDRVRNLNDNVLYIELPEGKLKKNKEFDIIKQEGSNVKIEVMENKRFIKITYSFDKSTVESKNLLSQPGYQSVSFKYGPLDSYTQFDSNLLPLIHKRIILSSDKDVPGNFETLPIYTTLMQQKVSFKKITENDYTVTGSSYINQPLSDAKLNYKKIEIIVSENSKLFDLSFQKTDNQDYMLINTSKATKESDKNKKGKLKIILIGNNGNCLVIYRDLYITKETNQVKLFQLNKQVETSPGVEENKIESKENVIEKPVEVEEIIDSSTIENKEELKEETTESKQLADQPKSNEELSAE